MWPPVKQRRHYAQLTFAGMGGRVEGIGGQAVAVGAHVPLLAWPVTGAAGQPAHVDAAVVSMLGKDVLQ